MVHRNHAIQSRFQNCSHAFFPLFSLGDVDGSDDARGHTFPHNGTGIDFHQNQRSIFSDVPELTAGVRDLLGSREYLSLQKVGHILGWSEIFHL